MRNDRSEGGFRGLLLVMCPFFTVFPALLLVLGAMSDAVQSWCLGSAGDAAGILKACRTWCGLMLGAVVLGVVLTVVVTILAARAIQRRGISVMWKNLLKMAVIPLAVEVLICGLMLKSEVLPLMRNVGPDLKQISSGTLEAREVWFLPGSSATHLPGYFGPENDLMRCQVREAGGELFTVYVPASLGFEPEGEYQTSQDEEWNLENMPRYQIAFTSRFALVPGMPEPLP